MIDVPVRVYDFPHAQPEPAHLRLDPCLVISWVDHDCFAGGIIRHKKAVLYEGAIRNGFNQQTVVLMHFHSSAPPWMPPDATM
jgi:hypothetical protein